MSEETLVSTCLDHPESLGSAWAIGESMRRVLKWAMESIRRRGIWTTCQVAVSAVTDVAFDWRYGTDTFQAVNVDEIETSSDNRAHAIRYRATKARPFRKLLRRLALPADTVFLDFGSGKGRVLMLAACERFRRVVGVEFSPPLCEVARRNVERFRKRTPGMVPIEIQEGDAAAYELQGDENVFFFYNPFDEVILNRVVERIRTSVARHPRPIWLIYCTPLHADVIERSNLFARQETFRFGGTDFRVYSRPEGTASSTSREAK